MSPRWRDVIAVHLSPGRSAMVREGRGLRPAPAVHDAWVAGDAQAADWNPVLDALEARLEDVASRGAAVSVVIGDAWVRYVAVPASAQLLRNAERLAHARHLFTETLGESAADWDVALATNWPGAPTIACAMPRELVEGLRAGLARHGCRLVSLLPQLVAAYGTWRRHLPDRGFWFASVSDTALSAVHVGASGFDAAYSLRSGVAWREDFRRLRRLHELGGGASGEPAFADVPSVLHGKEEAGCTLLADATASRDLKGRLMLWRRQEA